MQGRMFFCGGIYLDVGFSRGFLDRVGIDVKLFQFIKFFVYLLLEVFERLEGEYNRFFGVINI